MGEGRHLFLLCVREQVEGKREDPFYGYITTAEIRNLLELVPAFALSSHKLLTPNGLTTLTGYIGFVFSLPTKSIQGQHSIKVENDFQS